MWFLATSKGTDHLSSLLSKSRSQKYPDAAMGAGAPDHDTVRWSWSHAQSHSLGLWSVMPRPVMIAQTQKLDSSRWIIMMGFAKDGLSAVRHWKIAFPQNHKNVQMNAAMMLQVFAQKPFLNIIAVMGEAEDLQDGNEHVLSFGHVNVGPYLWSCHIKDWNASAMGGNLSSCCQGMVPEGTQQALCKGQRRYFITWNLSSHPDTGSSQKI